MRLGADGAGQGKAIPGLARVLESCRRVAKDAVVLAGEACAIPSVAAQGKGIREAAEWVGRTLAALGAEVVHVVGVPGAAPVVRGTIPGRDMRKTLLFYNHYDVQPPEPYGEWETPPFELTARNGRLYARGIADNKGDLVSRVAAVGAIKEALGELPCNVAFLVEGEEEVGSVNLERTIDAYPTLVSGDACIWESGSRDASGRVEASLGCKGVCYADIHVGSAEVDLHSSLAAIVANPAWRLIWALATLKGLDERIRVPGFYDRVRPPTELERQMVREIPETVEQMKRAWGVSELVPGLDGLGGNGDEDGGGHEDGSGGAAGAKERLFFEPTCNICGFTSGYGGPGSKTVLPARANAKLDLRLVPDQDPGEVARAFEEYLASSGYGDLEVTWLGNEWPYRTPANDPFVSIVARAVEAATGGKPVFQPNSPGTGPMHQVCGRARMPVVSVGVSHPASRAHAPNENIREADFVAGIGMIAAIILAFAAGSGA